MKNNKNQKRDAYANAAEKSANEGHYLDRLYNIAEALDHRDSMNAVLSLKQLYIFTGCKPRGSDGIQYEISMRLLIVAERDFKFTKSQLNKLWYGLHWDAREAFGLKFPYEDKITDQMRSNT